MESTILTTVLLPVALGIIMLGMGLTLTLQDFLGIRQRPKAALIGAFCQLFILPLLAFAVAEVFSLPGVFAVGLVLVSLCPGGVTSNAITFVARGDVALSVSLTAVSSVISPFTIPVVLGIALTYFQVDGFESTSLPVLETIGKLLVITVVPVGVGMFLRGKFPEFANRSERTFRIGSTVVLVAIVAGIVKNNWSNLQDYLASVGTAALSLNLAAMILGVAVAKGD